MQHIVLPTLLEVIGDLLEKMVRCQVDVLDACFP